MVNKKDKRPKIGQESSNPFELLERKKHSHKVSNSSGKSRFLKKYQDDSNIYQYTSKKSQKLQLYNLKEPINLTHKNQPIEEHYESDLEGSSDGDIDLRGDYTNIPQALENYKREKEITKRDKQDQQNLLSKIDSQFNDLDLSQFYKPTKGSLEYYKNPDEKPKKLDKYDLNLRDLQFNKPSVSENLELTKKFKSSTSVDERCDIVKKIVTSNETYATFSGDYVRGTTASIIDVLRSQNPDKFCHYFDVFIKGLNYLYRHNPKEYKAYFTKEVECLLESIENGVGYTLEAILLVYMIAKVCKVDSDYYQLSLLVVEEWLKCFVRDTNHIEKDDVETWTVVKLLLALTYSLVLDGEFYMPYFYHFCMKICKIVNYKVEFVPQVLTLVKITLNMLLKNGCHINPAILQILMPHLDTISDNYKDINVINDYNTGLKSFIQDILSKEPERRSLDVYNTPKIKFELPKIKFTKKFSKDRIYTKNQEKSEYKSLKRQLLQNTFAEIERNSKLRLEKRLKSQQRYKEVVRNAMLEQDMLKKLATTEMIISKIRFFGTLSLHKFNKLASTQLRNLYEHLELLDDVDALEFDGTVLNVELANRKMIVVNKHEPSQQIWYSSFTGVDYFDYSDNKWTSSRSGHTLTSLIADDVYKAIGQNVDFSKSS
ncbi:conserved hypothetical protein [Theileria equi strain WA]|uniref:Uncharacterized protein n=1 Tax=Theileria equi strain WA TaxID=1537102 RepID=L1LCG5_THEEQ|nr:conserved hypothetical protein [Theileria equi strain WA]EKX72969.1 conserved hypothetical protein [Theileria equi strain WA]|eukprot:XP_004832421.1 conserved hypothetical protein [Theileria equi strain WA]